MNNNRMVWDGLGFPVSLVGFSLVDVDHELVPDVNMKEIQEQAFLKLITWAGRLTGQHVRFARHYLHETQFEFAKNINVKNASSVSQWEAKGNSLTEMDVNTELILRMHLLHSISSNNFRKKGIIDSEWKRLQNLLNDALSKLHENAEPLEIEKAS